MPRMCRVRNAAALDRAAAIEAEIARIRSLALDALRRHWRVIFGRTPPAALSKDLLGRMIAYRLQERAFGGLIGVLGRAGAEAGAPRGIEPARPRARLASC
jgi:hypothetical protein